MAGNENASIEMETNSYLIDPKYLKDAYNKTHRELDVQEGCIGKCLPELMACPQREDLFKVDNEWEEDKYALSLIKQLQWNLIEASFEEECLKGNREV